MMLARQKPSSATPIERKQNGAKQAKADNLTNKAIPHRHIVSRAIYSQF